MTALHFRPIGVAGLIAIAACGGNLLNVEHPDVIEPGNLLGETGAAALYQGARSEFIAAHDGGTVALGLVYVSGLFTDEFIFPATPPELISIDRRDNQSTSGTIGDVFFRLHRARNAAERAAAALAALPSAATDPRIGEVEALGALVYSLFGETFCSGVPFSTIENAEVVPGSSVTTPEMFTQALSRLDAAAAKAGGNADIVNLIRVSKGRVLMNLNRYPEAATAVAQVPTSFRFDNTHTTADPASVNQIKVNMWDSFFLGMGNQEGTNGLDYVTANDPRIESVDAGISGFDLQTEVLRSVKYQAGDAAVTMASGIEARMIQAEAALKAGDLAGWLGRLNEARATTTLAPLSDPGTLTERVNLTFRERAFWMYGTAHRLGDLRRLVTQYGRNAESVFPTGDYHKDNLQRAKQVSLLVPQTEENNPKFNRSACDPTKA